MHRHIRQITQEVLLRKRLNWSLEYIPKEVPPISEDLYLSEMLLILLNHNLDQVNERKGRCIVIERIIKNIHNLKINLETEEWPCFSEISDRSKQWYIHDLLFLVGLCYYLNESIYLTKGYCRSSHLPSVHTCLLYQINDKADVLEIIKPYSTRHPWIISTLQLKSELSLKMDEAYHLSQKDNYMLRTSIRRLKKCPPVTLFMENYYIRVLYEFTSTIKAIRNDHHHLRRLHLAASLTLSMISFGEARLLIEDYIKILKKENSDKLQWEEEYCFWDLQKLIVDTSMPGQYDHKKFVLLQISQILSHIKMEKGISETIPPSSPELIWHGSTQEFAKQFHSFIANRRMSLEGYFDIEPLVKKLHQTISVKKDKGSGYLSYSSLLTYFKQLNADLF